MNGDKELPGRWIETTLGEVTAPTSIIVKPDASTKLTYIGMEHVEAETMRLIGTIPASELKSTAKYFHSGDVLYGRMRPYLNKVFRPDFEGLCSSEFIVFQQSSNLNSHYLQYFLNSWSFREFASHLVEGDRPRVDWNQLKVFRFLLPPLPEQHRIIAAIEQQFTRLDASVEALKQAQKKLKLYRSAVLKAAVEGRLTEDWRIKHPTTEPAVMLLARILQEHRAKWETEQLAKMAAKGFVPRNDKWKEDYKEPAKPDIESLSDLPEGWCWATFDQIADITGGVTKGRSLTGRVTITLPYLRVANVQRYFLDLSVVKTIEIPQDEVEKYLLRSGDVLMIEGGDADKLGRAALWKNEISPCIHQNHIFRSRLHNKDVLPAWLVLYANSERGQSYFLKAAKQTINLASINLTQLRNCPIALLPFAEQEQIVSSVEEHLSIISKLETIVDASLKRAERARQSILQAAFAGLLVQQDPHDEPASLLLERIRKEQEERNQLEREAKKQKGSKTMASWRTTTNKQRKPLREMLIEAKQPITPEDLFKRAGFQVNDVDEFFADLREEVIHGSIRQLRPDDTYVLLEAVGE